MKFGNSSTEKPLIEDKERMTQLVDDPLYVSAHGNPDMSIVTTLFNGNNYISWSLSMHITLTAKSKQEFIDGSIPYLENIDAQVRWVKEDSLVRSWILNSLIAKEKENFIHTETTMDLWEGIKKRYQIKNEQSSFQIQKEISSMKIHKCCKISEEVEEADVKRRLSQFLTGLNDSYDFVRSQILVSELELDLDRAYASILLVQKQREISHVGEEIIEHSAMAFNSGGGNVRGKIST
ncbi:uncharacterized protein LOC124933301 [Impatiens glandulifera]|uniref:uncharacterized protein LOC124933301 n=1 Tax=Impatiens glandulifera TaxID=253017 RepID=UPI001FB0FEFF|nr:uncharacterized protein LOC124933301 [Impatiens glandulifera]